MINEHAIKVLLAAFGYTPAQIRENFELKTKAAFDAVQGFDDRLKAIEASLARLEAHAPGGKNYV